MQITVTIKDVAVSWAGVGAKRYGKAVVTFDGNKGEKKQNIVSFNNPDVFEQVQKLVGQTVNVEISKNDAGFWNWDKIIATGAGNQSNSASTGGAAGSAVRVSGSNYESKEERAKRQVLIVKQSSLTAAVGTLSPGAKTALDPKAVIDLAQQYTDFVFAQPEDASGFDNMTDDLPY
jgi:hypothetical protein